MRFSLPSLPMLRAFTLVELLIALTLSLMLLLGVVELFSRVSGTLNHARTALNLTENLDAVERRLRTDLSLIPLSLTQKPQTIVNANSDTVSDLDGYLEITEGERTILDPPYVNEDGKRDDTVGDVDDIIGFTITDPVEPFRGWIDGELAERHSAEIVWFVRGNTLYRRVILLDDGQKADLADRTQRFGHNGRGTQTFPYPLYPDAQSPWKYLRMPTIEEFYSGNYKTETWFDDSVAQLNSPQPIENPDLWNQPHLFPNVQDKKSGSLIMYVDSPRSQHAGEDIVLTNVLSFDIKVWDDSAKDFVDLGTGTTWGTTEQPGLLPGVKGVWDSWTQAYKNGDEVPPPYYRIPPYYRTSLTAIRFTIRCFDPSSQTIKQISVVHRFK